MTIMLLVIVCPVAAILEAVSDCGPKGEPVALGTK